MVSEHASPLAVLGGVDAGGQNVHVAALSTALAGLGVEVDVYTRRDNANLPAAVPFGPGVTVHHVDAGPPTPVPKDELLPHMGEFGRQLRRAWSAREAGTSPDVVHSHFWMSGIASLAAARPLGIPVLHTFHALGVVKRRHQGDKDTSPPQRAAVETGIARRADRLIATCAEEVRELTALGAPPGKVSVIPCGVDLSLFTPDGPVDPSEPDGRPRLVVVSRLVERKGIGNVIAALPSVPGAELVIAGGPPREGLDCDAQAVRLRALARRLGVLDRVDIRGQMSPPDVAALLRSADAVVCVPWYEPFGIVPLEAMACGVPVVASRVGGLQETVVDGCTGVHIPPRRPDLLGPALAGLLRDRDRLRAMGDAGLRRARRRYGWATVAADTLETYRSVAEASGAVPTATVLR